MKFDCYQTFDSPPLNFNGCQASTAMWNSFDRHTKPFVEGMHTQANTNLRHVIIREDFGCFPTQKQFKMLNLSCLSSDQTKSAESEVIF